MRLHTARRALWLVTSRVWPRRATAGLLSPGVSTEEGPCGAEHTSQRHCTRASSTESTKCNVACTILGVPGESAQDFTDALLTYGAHAAWVSEAVSNDGEEEPIYADPVPGQRGQHWLKAIWHNCQIVALFSADEGEAAVESIVQESAQTAGVTAALELAHSSIYDEDWEAQIKASYVPLQLTDDLWIIPEWCEPPQPDKVNLILKPGLAFGTGEHPTTRLCLEWLQSNSLTGLNVVDYGCGSGILSVAACLYGARHVVAVDVDPLAVRATMSNAALNGCKDRCEIYVGAPFAEDPDPLESNGASIKGDFDVCVANILKPALLDLRSRLVGYLKPGGSIVLAGILENQVSDIIEAYSQDVADWSVTVDRDWALIHGVKRA